MTRNLPAKLDSCLARRLHYAGSTTVTRMIGHLQHHARRAGTCFTQGQQRCVVMRPVVDSIWTKTAGAGHQN